MSAAPASVGQSSLLPVQSVQPAPLTVAEILVITPLPLQSTFYDPDLYAELEDKGIFKNHSLKINSTLPACSIIQNNAFVDLIDESFDIPDHDGTPVLTGVSARILFQILLDLPLCKSSQTVIHLQAAGSMVKTVLEKDPDWINSSIKRIYPDYKGFTPLPKRALPDLDIHLLCKKKSAQTRTEIIDRYIDELGKKLVQANRPYVENEIKKAKSLGDSFDRKDKYFVTLLDAIKCYDEIENSQTELKEVKLCAIASILFRKKCLKNLAKANFGNIISIGKLELLLTEEPGHLLTADRLVMQFKPDIKKDESAALSLLPSDKDGLESLLHHTFKIASIPVATEYSFGKACAYITLGNFVLLNEEFKSAQKKFKRSIYSKDLTNNGVLVLNRFAKKHLKEHPEEGVCQLLTMFRFLQKGNGSFVIPKIVEHLRKDLSIVTQEPLLNAILRCLTSYSNNYDLLESVLWVLPCLEPMQGINESWIKFKQGDRFAPYTLRFEVNPNSFDLLASSYDKKAVATMLCLLLEIWPNKSKMLSVKDFEALVNWFKVPDLKVAAFKYLIKVSNPEAEKLILLYLPEVIESSSPLNERKSLLEDAAGYFSDTNLKEIIKTYVSENDLLKDKMHWLLNLIKINTPPDTIYFIWSQSSKNNAYCSMQIALQLMPKSAPHAFKIIQLGLLEYSEGTKKLEDAAFSQIMARKSGNIEPELLGTVENVGVWIIRCMLRRDQDGLVKTYIDNFRKVFPIHKALIKSSIYFWPFLSLDENIDAFQVIARTGKVEKIFEGLQYLIKQPLTSEQVLRLLSLFPAIREALQKVNFIHHSSILKLVVELLKIEFPDQKEFQVAKAKLIIEIYKDCETLLMVSRGTFYITILSKISSIIFSRSYNDFLNAKVNDETLMQILFNTLNDSSKPLDAIKKSLIPFLDMLLKCLRESKKEDLISKIVQALEQSNQTFEESKEFNECRKRVVLQRMKTQSSSNLDVGKFFEKEIHNSQEIYNFFASLLKSQNADAANHFLKVLKVHQPALDLISLSKQLLQKITALLKDNRLELCTQFFTVATDNKLHILHANEYKEIAKSLFEFINNQNTIHKYWSFLYKLVDLFPDLKPVFLPALFEKVLPKQFPQIESFWMAEIENKTYAGLEPSDAANCCVAYVKGLGKIRISAVLDLVEHIEELNKLFGKTAVSMYTFLEEYSKALFAFAVDPDALSADNLSQFNKFTSYFNKLVEQTADFNSEFFRNFHWNCIKFKINSVNIDHHIVVWKQLHTKFLNYTEEKHDVYKADIDLIKSTLTRLLENIKHAAANNSKAIIELAPDAEDAILFISRNIRTAIDRKHLGYYFKTFDPLIFLGAFKWIYSAKLSVEAIYWCEIYLDKLPIDKKGEVKITSNISTLLKCIFALLFKTNEKLSPKATRSVCAVLGYLTKINNEFVKIWTIFISRVLERIYDKDIVIAEGKLWLSVWETALESSPTLPIALDRIKFFDCLKELLKADREDLFIALWNTVYVNTLDAAASPPMKYVYRVKNGNVLHQSNCYFPQSLKTHKMRVCEEDFHYFIHFFSDLDKLPKNVHPLIFDIQFMCIYKLFDINKLGCGSLSYKDIVETFTVFLDLIPITDPLIKTHSLDVLPLILVNISKWNKDFIQDDLFYEGLIKASVHLPDGITLDIDKDRLLNTAERILNEYKAEDNVQLLKLAATTCQNLLKLSCYSTPQQFINLFKGYYQVVTDPDNYIFDQNSFNLQDLGFEICPDLLAAYLELIKDLPDREAFHKEFYRLMGTQFFKFLTNIKFPRHIIIQFLQTPLTWLKEFQNTFDGMDLDYQKIGTQYLETVLRYIPSTNMKEGKLIGENFIAFLTFDTDKSKKRGNRAALVNRFFQALANSPHDHDKILYMSFYNFVKKNQFYEGLPNLEKEGNIPFTLSKSAKK